MASNKGTSAEALDVSFELSKLLDCGLDKESLSICIALLETGVNPEVRHDVLIALPDQSLTRAFPPAQALAEVINQLRQQTAAEISAHTQPGASHK
jgi:mitotic-spindle organizing protein 1